MCSLLFFCSNPRCSPHWAGVAQHRLDRSQLLSKASLKCTGEAVPVERWDRKTGRCIPPPQHFPASSPPPPSSSFTSFAPPLPYHSSSVLFSFFFHSPAISSCFLCYSSVHTLMTAWNNSSLFPSWGDAGAHWLPQPKTTSPACSLLLASL